MSTLAVEPTPSSGPRPVAPMRHTLVMVGLFLAMAIWGAVVQNRVAAHSATLPRPERPALLYLSLMAMEWGLVLYVWKGGLRRSGTSLRELVGGRWSRPRDVAADAAIALATWGVWTLASAWWQRLSGVDHSASVDGLLPRTPIEIVLWIALSMSAGFCEELVFRGYLQRQFHAFTRNAGLAVVLQALIFGVSHGYQGVQACLKISAYGLLFGVLALRRRSLRPGMIAHAWTDVAAGIFRI